MSDKLDWDVALIGYDPTQRARYLDAIIDARQSGGPEPEMDCGRRKTDLVRLIDDDDGRRSFYDKLDWDVVLIGYDPTQRARYLDAIIDARQSGGLSKASAGRFPCAEAPIILTRMWVAEGAAFDRTDRREVAAPSRWSTRPGNKASKQ